MEKARLLCIVLCASLLIPLFLFGDQVSGEVKKSLRYVQSAEFKKKVESWRKEIQKKGILKQAASDSKRVSEWRKKTEGKGVSEEKKLSSRSGVVEVRKSVFGGKVIVFVSSSMPPGETRKYMEDSLKEKGFEFEFVMRGFIGGMKKAGPTIRFAYRVLRGEDGSLLPLSLDINPIPFRRYRVASVPTFILERNGRKVKEVKGDADLSYILEKLTDLDVKDGEQLGTVYPIAEPDALEEIEEAAKRLNPEEFRRRILSRIGKMETPSVELPPAEERREREVRLSYALPFTVWRYPRGYTFNPLDYVRYPGRIVIFDGCREEEVRWASQLPEKEVARFLTTCGDCRILSEKIGVPVFPAGRILIERFKIERTPSVIEQEGNILKVKEIPVRR